MRDILFIPSLSLFVRFGSRSVSRWRDVALDRVRGFSIVLMVIDHLLIIFDSTNFLRYSLTRVALPLFCIVAGSLLGDRVNLFRWLQVLLCGIFCTVFSFGQGTPDILCVLAVVLPLACWFPSAWLIFIGLLQAKYLPFHVSGYQVGWVLALVLLGRLFKDDLRAGVLLLADCLPSCMAFFGRWPLSIYVGHVVLLCFLVELL